ncbi:MAG: hypothetical protein RIM83_02575 [Allomuricauda sp.]
MKTQIVFLIVALLMITSLKAQVKIGDNPQNLDPASVLELESNNRVLVITRVTTAQMSTINPLRGALVYNTDEECIHYYNGVEWINICEALDNSFTVSSEAVFNTLPDARDSTIVVTQTETPDGINYNFEVNQITGDNIYNGTLFGSDFASGAIGSREIQDSAVELKKLEDGTMAGQLIQWDGNSWELITDTDLNITEGDGEIGNEVVGPTDTTLILDGNGSEIEPYTLDVSPMGIGTPELADNAVTTDKILNGNITDDKLDKTNIPLSGFGAANADVDLGLNKLTNVAEPTVATDAATMNYVDNAITDSETADNDTDDENELSDLSITGTLLELTNAQVGATGVDLGNTFATDLELTNAITASETADDDKDDQNELSDLSITGTLLELTNAEVGATGVDLGNTFATDTELTNAITASDAADNDKDSNNENQTVSPGDGISVTQNLQDFEVAVTNPVIAMGKVDAAAAAVNATGLDVAGVVRNAIGFYTVNLDSGLTDDYVVQLTAENTIGNVRIIQASNQGATTFDVLIFDETGASQDSDWYFTVIRF